MKSVRLKNYRSFSDTGTIDLKPVNILLGKNSVGKSSFLKFFPLLKQSRVKHPNGLFLWYADDVDFKDFKNTVKNGEGNIEIELKFQRKVIDRKRTSKTAKLKYIEITVILTLSGNPKDENLDYLSNLRILFGDIALELTYDPVDEKNFFHPLKEFRINDIAIDAQIGIIPQLSDSGFIPNLYFQRDENEHTSYVRFPEIGYELDFHSLFANMDLPYKYSQRSGYNGIYYKTVKELTETFNNLSPEIAREFESPEGLIGIVYQNQINSIIEDINGYIDDLARNIFYIQPVRANAKRYYRFQNLAVDEIDSHGDNLPMYLNSLSRHARESLNRWIEPFFKFKLEVCPKEGHIQINITETGGINTDKPVTRNLVDVGFGYSQLLPIIVQIWNALKGNDNKTHFLRRSYDNPPIIVIEQPELHLHPRMMEYFAKMLISLIREEGKNFRFIIETHSEALIEALGWHMASNNVNDDNKQRVNPEDIQVLIFNKEKDETDTFITVTHYDNNGFIEKWPYGFFSGKN